MTEAEPAWSREGGLEEGIPADALGVSHTTRTGLPAGVGCQQVTSSHDEGFRETGGTEAETHELGHVNV